MQWNAPYDDGGSGITSYIIEFRDTEGLRWKRAAMVDAHIRSAAIRGLKENKDYLFRVIAVNSIGPSDPLEVDFAVRAIRPAGVFTYNKFIIKHIIH